jgi:hypothetical protein
MENRMPDPSPEQWNTDEKIELSVHEPASATNGLRSKLQALKAAILSGPTKWVLALFAAIALIAGISSLFRSHSAKPVHSKPVAAHHAMSKTSASKAHHKTATHSKASAQSPSKKAHTSSKVPAKSTKKKPTR